MCVHVHERVEDVWYSSAYKQNPILLPLFLKINFLAKLDLSCQILYAEYKLVSGPSSDILTEIITNE